VLFALTLSSFVLAQDYPQPKPIGGSSHKPDLQGDSGCTPKPCVNVQNIDWEINDPYLAERWAEELHEVGGYQWLRIELTVSIGEVAFVWDGVELDPADASRESTRDSTVWYIPAAYDEVRMEVLNVGRVDAYYDLELQGWNAIPE
jgi:hypothetical protein